MIKEIEEKFVKKFIVKDKRERTLYELSSIKKRGLIMHKIFNLLDSRLCILPDLSISDDELFDQIRKIFDINKDCYVIAASKDDGKILPFKEAFQHMAEEGADYAIICSENIVVMKEEAIFGAPAKKLLYSK